MRVEDVADPIIKEPTDILVRVTTTGICAALTCICTGC